MHIAMICPLDMAVSPAADGNPHRAIGLLSEALVAGGHQVTLFAAEGSTGGSQLVSVPDGKPLEPGFREAQLLSRLLDEPHQFDIAHNHAGPATAALLSGSSLPLVNSIHAPCPAGEEEAWRRLGAQVCFIDYSPAAIPEGLALVGTVIPGPESAGAHIDLYRMAIDRCDNHRPWGHYEVLEDHPRHKVKRIVVSPGQRLSLQLDHRRAEHWLVIEGEGLVTLDDNESLVPAGQAIDIPRGARHRICNPGEVPCVFIEVQTGDYFGEDDIVRLEDDYGRSS